MNTEIAEHWFDPKATTFGDRVAGAREQGGMTQEEMAKRLGVKIKTLKDWEDDLSEPRANKLSMMAGLLNVSLPWLITGEGTGPDAPVDQIALSYTATGLLAEIRDIKLQLSRSTDRLAQLEVNLRDMLQGGDQPQAPEAAQEEELA